MEVTTVGLRSAPARHPRLTTVLGLAALVVLSVVVRTRRLDVGFWIDEALSVGIADRPLGDIPGVLRLDGSPPLYYLILHVWTRAVGTGEAATHALSVLLAGLTVPVAWALARSLLGERAGWAAAVLFAVNPFLNQYAQETRMYALVVLLGTVVAATFVGGFVMRRGRRWTIAFALSLAALLYTHNWALFLTVACGLAWLALVVRDREPGLGRDGLLAFGVAGLAFMPWLPSLLHQAAHTGAPWARVPGLGQLAGVPVRLLESAPAAALAVTAGAGALALARRPAGSAGRAVGVLAWLFAGTVALAWLASQISPAWASRYLAVALGPLLLLCAAGLSRAGAPGSVALVIALGVGVAHPGPPVKSNVRAVAEAVDPSLAPGDLVVSTQPEQLPALAYYLETPGLRWATLTGRVEDVGVTDWRDGVRRLSAASPGRDLAPLLDGVPPGGRVLLVRPQIRELDPWRAPWTRLVHLRSAEWAAALSGDARFRRVAVRPEVPEPAGRSPLEATVFVRVGTG